MTIICLFQIKIIRLVRSCYHFLSYLIEVGYEINSEKCNDQQFVFFIKYLVHTVCDLGSTEMLLQLLLCFSKKFKYRV